MRFPFFLFLLSFLFHIGCGYKVCGMREEETLSVEVIQKMPDGMLQKELVYAIAKGGKYRFSESSPFVLKVEIVETLYSDVGYRYKMRNDGTFDQKVVPSESRITMIAKGSSGAREG